MADAAALVTSAKIIAAWNDYLEQCRQASHPWQYDEVEERAWAELTRTLRALGVSCG